MLALAAPLVPGRAGAEPAARTSRSRVSLAIPVARGVLPEVARRIRAEIETAGFDVVSTSATASGSSGAPFAAIALAEGAGGPAADVSLFLHPEGGLSAALRIDAHDLEPSAVASGLAIRVVERLRASIAEVAAEERIAQSMAPDVAAWAGVGAQPNASTPQAAFVSPPVSSNAVAPNAIAPQPNAAAPYDMRTLPFAPERPRAPRPATWIGGGISSLFSYRGFAPALGPLIHVRRDLPQQFSIGGAAAAPFGLTDIESIAGTAIVRQVVALATADRSFGPPDWVVSPRLTLGLGVHVTIAEGEASGAELRSHTAAGAAFAASANGGAGIRLTESVRLTADFWMMLVLPEPIVVMDSQDTARAGLPLLGLSTGIEVAP